MIFYFRHLALLALVTMFAPLLFSACSGGGGGNSSAGAAGETAAGGLPGKELIPEEYSYLQLKLTLPPDEKSGMARSLTMELHNKSGYFPYEGTFIVTEQEGLSDELRGKEGTWIHNENNESHVFRLYELATPGNPADIEISELEASVDGSSELNGNTVCCGNWQAGSLRISLNEKTLFNHPTGSANDITITLSYVR